MGKPSSSLSHFILITFLAFPLWCATADGPVTPEQGSVSAAGKFTPRSGQPQGKPSPESAIQVLGGGKLKIGDVLLDASARTVLIPARVNMAEGTVEYALVMESGKLHESIFATRATAEHLHIACMLLGLSATRQGAGTAVPEESAVKIEVAWDTNGPEKRVPLSDCVALADSSGKTDKTLPDGPWFYAGSQIDAAGFAATREGSLISVITDPQALITNPHPDREDDKIHLANAQTLPRKGVPVRIILTLPPAKKTSPTVEKAPTALK